MRCLPCAGGSSTKRIEKGNSDDGRGGDRTGSTSVTTRLSHSEVENQPPAAKDDEVKIYYRARTISFDEMVAATDNFNSCNCLGQGGFGKVYKGKLPDTGEIVAIKQFGNNGVQMDKEFVTEVVTLSSAYHPNLVKIIGYCPRGPQRLVVCEYMPLGSLEDHLHGCLAKKKELDWNSRINIVLGAARGLEHLHNKMETAVVHRDLKSSNILLGEGYFPKLSDFGYVKVGSTGDRTRVSTRVVCTYGYCAPEYAGTKKCTLESDIYSFGVVLLEIVTGRKAIDVTKPDGEQHLVAWARPLLADRRYKEMVDPALEDQYPMLWLYGILGIAAKCVQEKPNLRPPIEEIAEVLKFIASRQYDPRFKPSRRPVSKK